MILFRGRPSGLSGNAVSSTGVLVRNAGSGTPVCRERFSHLTMTTTAKGYAKQWVCADREACLARQTGCAGERVRKAPRR